MNVPPMRVGIIGCGVISKAYLEAAPAFPQLAMAALADIAPEAAAARGREFGLPAVPIEALLADPAIELVLNLTVPVAHASVADAALASGKHCYLEKPLAVSVPEGRQILALAERHGRRIGCAPDTFLGAGQQTARAAVDAGRIGQVVGGTAMLMLPGHERWHPNPDFYYAKAGGGPMLDMGPYYLTALVNCLGPIELVSAMRSVGRSQRTIKTGPRAGMEIEVQTPTHILGLLRFVSGPIVQIATSFEVWRHRHAPIELYGTGGSLAVPDPNRFDGAVELCAPEGDWVALPPAHGYGDRNWRILGLAEMAAAIGEGRPHRCSAELACHVLEVMTALVDGGPDGAAITITSRCERPAAMAPGLAIGTIS